MNNGWAYPLGVIAVIAAVTFALRALPFLLFRKKTLPDTMQYLSRVLPPCIMTVLVIYCLRNTSFRSFPFGIPEIVSCLLVAVLQFVRKNMYLSILAVTVCYMVLIRLF